VIDPDDEPVASNYTDGNDGHYHRGKEQEGENFHALAARPSDVVASDGHVTSLNVKEWAASGPLPAHSLENFGSPTLIQIKDAERTGSAQGCHYAG